MEKKEFICFLWSRFKPAQVKKVMEAKGINISLQDIN